MTWASVGDTLNITGMTVTSQHVDQAQGIVELFADTTTEADEEISTKNRGLLKKAVAYQAAFISEHPDLFTHQDVQEFSQDGRQGKYVYSHENAALLAPLARRCISRLSWKRPGSVRVRKGRKGVRNRDWDRESNDVYLTWKTVGS